jgi:hypothetical protein
MREMRKGKKKKKNKKRETQAIWSVKSFTNQKNLSFLYYWPNKKQVLRAVSAGALL